MVERDDAAGCAQATTDSPDATRRLARRLGELCRGGEVILLVGDLGAGKTCFAQGLAAGLGVPADIPVTSPTFTLHGEYPGRLIFNHLDLYRLDEPCSLEGIGVEEMLVDTGAVTAVEWPELLAEKVDADRLEVRIADLGNGGRSLSFAARGERHLRLLAGLRRSGMV